MRNATWTAVTLIVACTTSGCFYTVAGTNLPPIQPPAAEVVPTVEQTVGDFSFTLEGGKMVTSNFIGRQFNTSVLKVWKENGYIREETYVPSSEFTGKADYQITLSGTQYGESSILMQILSGLTLYILPYTVEQKFDVQYLLEEAATGKKYSAAVEETYKAYVELFLLFALPVAQSGQNDAIDRMAKHLYSQLYKEGAFQVREEDSDQPDAPEELKPLGEDGDSEP